MQLRIRSKSAQAARSLQLIDMCVQYALLSNRASGGVLNPDREPKLKQLRQVFEGDDRGPGRRQFQRYETYLPAVVKTPLGVAHAIVINISGGGLLLATATGAEVGDQVQVKLGQPDQQQYVFSCRVARTLRGRYWNGLACQLDELPREVPSDEVPESEQDAAD